MEVVKTLLTRLQAADRRYDTALEHADRLKHERDTLVLRATLAGATRADIAKALGITRARAQQLVERARRS